MPRSILTPLAAFCSALAWSGAWITGKLAVTSAPPLEITTARFVIATLVLAMIAAVTRTRLRGGELWPVVLAGVFGYFGYNALVFVGLTLAPASDGALIVPTLIGAALLLPLGLLEKGYADVPGWSIGVWLNVLYLALAVSVASFILFYWVVRRVGAGVAAMSSYFVPVLTLAMAVVFLGDRPHPLQLVGGLVILAGVRLATLRLTGETAPVPEGAA